MKLLAPIISSLVLLFSASLVHAQSADTIYTLKNEKIACKVHEIGQIEIKYKKIENPDGPYYTILRERVRSIKYANGFEEMIIPDEMDVHKEEPIMNKRSIIKFEVFSPMFDQVSIGYERVLRPGINVEAKIGFINNSMFPFSFENDGDVNPNILTQGAFGKVGLKVLLGSHTYSPGAKYRHPLHGGYFGFYIGQTAFVQRGLKFYSGTYPMPYPASYIYSDRRIGSTSLTILYGNQFVLANKFTLGAAIGVGYAINYDKYTNPEVYDLILTQYYGNSNNMPSEMYSHLLVSNSPICLTGNFTIGYILK
ncbi:MAG: DUF3575 domain-containing protein [Flavobacteriales bacterium]